LAGNESFDNWFEKAFKFSDETKRFTGSFTKHPSQICTIFKSTSLIFWNSFPKGIAASGGAFTLTLAENMMGELSKSEISEFLSNHLVSRGLKSLGK